MSITTDRKASVSLSEQEVVDRLFHFFPKGVRKDIVCRRLTSGGLGFTFVNATDDVVKTLEENFADKDKKAPAKGKKKMDQGTLLKMSVDDIGFSMRARNALIVNDIKIVADISKYTRKKVIRSRNVGEVTMAEIEAFMKRNGLHWAEEPKAP